MLCSHQRLPVLAARVGACGLCVGACGLCVGARGLCVGAHGLPEVLAACAGLSRARCVRGAGAVSVCP